MTEDDRDFLLLINQIHDDFVKFQEGRRQVHLKQGTPHPRFAVLYGLACHADMLSREVLPMLDTEDARSHLAAVPIVRSIFEAGLTAQWIARTPLAEYRIAKKHRDVQREVTAELRESYLPGLREAANERADQYDESRFVVPEGTPPSTSIRTLCQSFNGGTDFYLIYRMLCGNTHPGVEAIDVWLDSRGEDGFSLLPAPHDPWHGLLGAISLWGVLWSAVALDDLVKNSPRRNLLNRVAGKGRAPLRLTFDT